MLIFTLSPTAYFDGSGGDAVGAADSPRLAASIHVLSRRPTPFPAMRTASSSARLGGKDLPPVAVDFPAIVRDSSGGGVEIITEL